MEDAVESVQLGIFSVKRASKEWGVCRSSLQNRLKGVHTGIVGSPKKFTDAEEDGLVELLLSCGELGVPISKVLLWKVVRNLGLSKGTVFVVVLWSIDWLICFWQHLPSDPMPVDWLIDWLIEREFIKSLLFLIFSQAGRWINVILVTTGIGTF